MVASMSDTAPVKIPQPGAGRSSAWLAAAGYLAVALACSWPLARQAATHMTGSPFGDPLLNAWILGWDAERLRHGLHGVWQAPQFYPAPDTLAWSEHLLGVAIVVAPLHWLTSNIVLVYNVAWLGSTVLAGVGMYLLALELTGRRDAAWLAGLLFACLPYRVAQAGHLQILVAGWMPLALLGLHRFLRSGSRRALAGFVAAYLLTALSNGYFLFFLAVPVAIVAGWHLVDRVRRRDRPAHLAASLGAAGLVLAAALAPVAAAYLRVRDTQGLTRTRSDVLSYSATPASYGAASTSLRFWGGRLPEGRAERQLFPGLTLAGLALIGLSIGWRRTDVRLYAAIAAAAFALSLGPEPDLGVVRASSGPYDWLSWLPGVSGLRVPARLAMIVYLALAALAAVGAAALLTRRSGRAAGSLVALLSLGIVVEGLPALQTTAVAPVLEQRRAPYAWLRGQPRGPMLELPVGGTRESVLYLAGTLVHGNPIVNGYSGYGSSLEDFFGGPPSLEPEHAGELLRAARAVGVRYLLVHASLYPDREFAAGLLRALRERAEHVEAVHTEGTTSALVLRPLARPPSAPLDPMLALDRCHAEVSHYPEAAGRAVDGSVETRWLSQATQRGGEWVVVRCPDTRVLTQVRLVSARRSYSNYPRALRIERSLDGVAFETAWEGGVVAELAEALAGPDRPAAVRLDLPPGPFRAVRVTQTGSASRGSFWAVDELELRGR
jgi:hypothetical protein